MYKIYKVKATLPQDDAEAIPPAELLAQSEEGNAMHATYDEYCGNMPQDGYAIVLVGPDGLPILAAS